MRTHIKHTAIPTIIDPSTAEKYPSATRSIIVGISVSYMYDHCSDSKFRNSDSCTYVTSYIYKMPYSLLFWNSSIFICAYISYMRRRWLVLQSMFSFMIRSLAIGMAFCMCVCVFMYVCMYVCIYVYMYVCMYAFGC